METVTSADSGWDAARAAFNLAVDQRPERVALPRSVEDVVAAVEGARADGLRVAAQGTGHAAGAVGSLEGAVLVRTGGLDELGFDAGARQVRAGAGVKWGRVIELTSPERMSPLMGSSPTVGVAGYTLGGGLSFLGRKHGLAASKVSAIELVTAEGRALRVDAETEPELFWALRGGGGSFGVVTALEFSVVELPELYAGAMLFPIERADEVLHAWRAIATDAPEELTSLGRLLRVPDVPGPPEPMRGRAFALVEGVYLGPEAEGAELLEPVRALGPAMDTFASAEPAVLAGLHMDPPEPVPARTGYGLLGELTEGVVDDVIAAAGAESDCVLVSVELRQTGGALSRPDPNAGALSRLPGQFSMFAVGALMDPSLGATLAEQLERVGDCVRPVEAGRYINYSDEPLDCREFFDDETNERLRAVKARWDPDGLFAAAHPVTA